ncbi:hypothetical protein D3C85_1102230 [compost metagenome]
MIFFGSRPIPATSAFAETLPKVGCCFNNLPTLKLFRLISALYFSLPFGPLILAAKTAEPISDLILRLVVKSVIEPLNLPFASITFGNSILAGKDFLGTTAKISPLVM